MMRVLDLFSGIGGFSLGLERAGMKTVAFCEIDPFCRRVLAKHWPGVPCYDDVRTLTAERLDADGIAVDLICGGFPCQDLSLASSTRQGLAGKRSGLWSEFARLIRELQPKYTIVENTSALLFGTVGDLLRDLSEIGFNAEWHAISAAHIGAPHERDRLWLVAYPHEINGLSRVGILFNDPTTLFAEQDRNRASIWMETTSRSARMGNGFSDRVDRRRRTEGLGNAVVPQIPEMIGRAILQAEGAAA